jgi:hypothetical protein
MITKEPSIQLRGEAGEVFCLALHRAWLVMQHDSCIVETFQHQTLAPALASNTNFGTVASCITQSFALLPDATLTPGRNASSTSNAH